MEEIAPEAILKGCGKWITASKYVELVSEKRHVKERQAKNLISDASA